MISNNIILFDGVCNFCNSTVNFIIKRDKKSQMHFAPLQSEIGEKLLLQYNLPTDVVNTFIFINNGKAYTRSTAALKVSKYLGGLWPFLYSFIIVPKFIRDAVYNFIAKNRYKWFGMKQECMIPAADMRKRFL
ncbi:MAG: thiol-disulfide oxidoreductase DCC family protein [Chitinophagaceae bacterium]|nr:thiol-disulfide oxidoreductase DCC family protein [Chitinophagaceae bacterium]